MLNMPFLPITRPLPAPIAAPPKARSRILFPVPPNRNGLEDTRRGEEMRSIRRDTVAKFMVMALALGWRYLCYDMHHSLIWND